MVTTQTIHVPSQLKRKRLLINFRHWLIGSYHFDKILPVQSAMIISSPPAAPIVFENTTSVAVSYGNFVNLPTYPIWWSLAIPILPLLSFYHLTLTLQSLKWKHHLGDFFFTGCTGSCQNDNFWCTSDENFVKMTTNPFHWCSSILTVPTGDDLILVEHAAVLGFHLDRLLQRHQLHGQEHRGTAPHQTILRPGGWHRAHHHRDRVWHRLWTHLVPGHHGAHRIHGWESCTLADS